MTINVYVCITIRERIYTRISCLSPQIHLSVAIIIQKFSLGKVTEAVLSAIEIHPT